MMKEIREKAREAILRRMEDLFLTQSAIVEDAENKGVRISPASLSRFLKNKQQYKLSTLTNEQIEWLCRRWCIDIKIDVLIMPYNIENSEKLLSKYADRKVVQNRKARNARKAQNDAV